MNDTERLITRIHDGKTAQAILAWIDPILRTLESDIHNKLKNLYRTGVTDSAVLAAATAELCVLEDLRTRIEGKIRAGNSAHLNLGENNGHEST